MLPDGESNSKPDFEMGLNTSLRLHTAGLTSSHKYQGSTAGHVFMYVGPISTKKYCCQNAHSADFLPPRATSSVTEKEPILFK